MTRRHGFFFQIFVPVLSLTQSRCMLAPLDLVVTADMSPSIVLSRVSTARLLRKCVTDNWTIRSRDQITLKWK